MEGAVILRGMTTAIVPTVRVTRRTPPKATAAATTLLAMRRRRWATAAEKAECLARFRKSGLNQSEFAREMKMSGATLSCWLRREREDGAGVADENGPLIEVALPAPVACAAADPGAVMIHLPSGVRLEVKAGTNAAWVGQLFGSLQPC